jgi:Asp-tRNA(Asn)/Glu-tRNA(Gln) amidotransferase A subunit family amidase
MNDLHALGAAEAARQIRAGTLSPVDLLDACLARIEVTGLSSDGLPLSVQLVGRVWGEAGLLAAAAWCEQVVGFKEAPGA